MPVAFAYTRNYIDGEKSLEMKNVFSKSRIDFDFQKFFNLVLTEQRAQRVDLARIDKRILDYINRLDPSPITDDIDLEEQPDDSSGRE